MMAMSKPGINETIDTHQARPNILFILADDLGWADVSYHGSEIMTPNIDNLAETGVRFTHHYVTPWCSPTRACLMSGRYSSRFGVVTPTNDRVFDFDMTTLPRALKSCGYETGITGKWHLGSKPEWGPRKFGFDHSYGSFAGGVNQLLHLYKKGPYSRTWHRNDEYIDEEGHATDLIGREAIRWIEDSANTEKPFFIYVAFTAVHVPIQEPPQWVELYDDKIGNISRRHYAACAAHMDDTIGQMVKTLERTGQRQNTLIVFISDNGAQRGWENKGLYPGDDLMDSPVLGSNLPLRGWKGQVYEGGIRTPALANWPDGLEPGKVEASAHIIDWMPTLCRLAGYQPEQNLNWDGRDIWQFIDRTKRVEEPRTLYWKTPNASALRHGDWKLIAHEEKEELYHLAADPNEKEDLAPRYPERIAQLQALLSEQRKMDR
jgi:arylsulfatase A-like enzyme